VTLPAIPAQILAYFGRNSNGARRPLPHIQMRLGRPRPGFRAGQIWARLNTTGQVETLLVVRSPLPANHILQPEGVTLGGSSPWCLMVDPVVPHAAPWPTPDPGLGR
jgi:hypothetical protein